MEERTKAADNYATTFFTKQLMYPERSHGGALIVGMQSKAPSNASPRNRRENTLKGVFSMIFIRHYRQRRQHKHIRRASCSKRARTCFGRRAGGIHVVNQQNWGRNARGGGNAPCRFFRRWAAFSPCWVAVSRVRISKG